MPVNSVGGHICGILAACNVKGGHEQVALLKNMRFSFGMFCNNLKNQSEIKKNGYLDALTGLYNRSRYKSDLPGTHARYKSSLACVYIDIIELREVNNTKGHHYGDEMLRVVAGETRKHFDTEYIYRIGGDEFILFISDAAEENLKIQCEKLASALSSFDYYIPWEFSAERTSRLCPSLYVRQRRKCMPIRGNIMRNTARGETRKNKRTIFL